ncbi:MAG TPA: phosphoribosyltransferase family protein [Solirubrobacteraceae bacterium]|nr:phosphoribosyltransferase family protein [Solirubrobacteraceae bacterium]
MPNREPDGNESRPRTRWPGAVETAEERSWTGAPVRVFEDRHDAGRRLALVLERFRTEQPVVLAMPRGGVPVAVEVARALDAPLDVAVVRKVGAPRNAEYAIGAVAEGGVRLVGGAATRALGLSQQQVQALFARAEQDLTSRVNRYRGTREPIQLEGRTAILVDDGLATGRSAAAALQSLRRRGAARLILAVPVAARESLRALAEIADEVVAVEAPAELWAVGYWYEQFAPTTDREVREALGYEDPAASD